MALHADHINVIQSTCCFIQFSSLREADPELVFLHAGRDVWMSTRIDIGVCAYGDTGSTVHIPRNIVDQFEFCRGLDIEKENTSIESIANLISCLADPCKYDLFRRCAGTQYPK